MRFLSFLLLIGISVLVASQASKTCRTRTHEPVTEPITEPITTKPTTKPTTKTTTKKPATCPSGWTLVQRSIGGWCIRVFNGMNNQTESMKACQTRGAVLSGAESAPELATMAALGRELLATSVSNWQYGTLRMAIERPNVNGAWRVTDGNNNGGTAGLVWGPGEPNKDKLAYEDKNCAMLFLALPGAPPTVRVHGTLQTFICHITWFDMLRGYVCGRRAT